VNLAEEAEGKDGEFLEMKENPVSDLQMIEAALNATAYCELSVDHE
jgi:hypothetical protein